MLTMPHKDPEARKAYERAYRARKRLENPEAVRATDRAKAKRWYDRDPEKARRLAREFYAAHRVERQALARDWRAANPERVADIERRHRTKAREAAAGRPEPTTCEVCGSDNRGRRMIFDHHHSCCAPKKGGARRVPGCSKCFRGWLCNDCNLVLGHGRDDPALLRKLADYLEANARGNNV